MTHEIIFISLRLLFSPSEHVRLKSPSNHCLRQLTDHERGPSKTEIIRDDSKCLSSECSAVVKNMAMKIYFTSRFHGCIYLFLTKYFEIHGPWTHISTFIFVRILSGLFHWNSMSQNISPNLSQKRIFILSKNFHENETF